MYEVKKIGHAPHTCPVVLGNAMCKTRRDVVAALLGFGGIIGTGGTNGRAFKTATEHVYVTIHDPCLRYDLEAMDRNTLEILIYGDAELEALFDGDKLSSDGYDTEEMRTVLRKWFRGLR